MSIELTGDLARRAAKHAALSDPARLRIVDLLSLGDHSPTELQSVIQMSSNLLAHHLKVLESVGIVVRTHSEADRRRSYVRLVTDALGELPPGSATTARRIVFVCTANSARSQLALALWRKASRIPAASAGTHPADQVASGAVAAAHRHALSLYASRPRALSEVLTDEDFVVTVCDRAHEELATSAPRTTGLHWSIADPVPSGTEAAFDAAFDQIAKRVTELAPRVAAA